MSGEPVEVRKPIRSSRRVKRAGKLRGDRAAADVERAALELLFDRFAPGIFVLDQRGRVIVNNRAAAAVLEAVDGLALNDANALVADGEGDDVALQRLIRNACGHGTGRGAPSGGALQVRRRSGRRAYALVVSPHAPARRIPGPRRPVAIVVAIDIDRQPLAAAVLRELFHLTAAEARVAERLARGHRAADIAGRLHIALPTVRTHIRRLLDKTGARSQLDLIRILAALGTTPGVD